LVDLSITTPPASAAPIQAVEPRASSVGDRIAALRAAHAQGLRTYAMFCPLLPGIGAEPDQIDELAQLAVECGAEKVFVEPVNVPGPGLKRTQDALAASGYAAVAIGQDDAGVVWPGKD
jgi:DNA repair photolyase